MNAFVTHGVVNLGAVPGAEAMRRRELAERARAAASAPATRRPVAVAAFEEEFAREELTTCEENVTKIGLAASTDPARRSEWNVARETRDLAAIRLEQAIAKHKAVRDRFAGLAPVIERYEAACDRASMGKFADAIAADVAEVVDHDRQREAALWRLDEKLRAQHALVREAAVIATEIGIGAECSIANVADVWNAIAQAKAKGK